MSVPVINATGRLGFVNDIFPLSGVVVVSTPTTFMQPTNLYRFERILFSVKNVDPTNAITVFFEPMDDAGLNPNTGLHGGPNDPLVIAPGETGDLEVGDNALRYVWTGQAQTTGPGYPAASMQWWVRGVSRIM